MDFITRQNIAQFVDGMKQCHFNLYFGAVKAQVIINTDGGDLHMRYDDFLKCVNDGEDNRSHFKVSLPDNPREWELIPISKLHDGLFAALEKEEENLKKSNQANQFWSDFVSILHKALIEFFEGKFQFKLQKKIQNLDHKKRKLDHMLNRNEFASGDLYINVKRFKSEEKQ